ncbi:DUF6282 family protein [Sciscionella marina]|uniref:DUF6282 family protein n=1 Tax=Sciscionella marina TaxID=508770 RepID=UPI000381351B|nr:DUF6282 family protein [Sciscionella marina]
MFDLHVHAAPDITPRLAGDREIVEAYAAAGFTGCVLKGHYESTVGRAAAVTGALPVYGGIALNQHAGGINPAAVRACLAAGGRVVWMPTQDARLQRRAGLPSLHGGPTYALPPVDPGAEEPARRICALIAEADAVLATGHLGAEEVAWLVCTARAEGVRRILLTHPGYTVPAMSAAQTGELAELGACAEITAFQLLHQPEMTAARLADFAARVGLEHIVLSSDAGQPDSPPPPQALELLVDALAGEGLDRGALLACAGERAERLVVAR